MSQFGRPPKYSDPEELQKDEDIKQEILIRCKSADKLSIDNIIDFQGPLKKLSKINKEKLKNSILKFGIIAPVFVWESNGDHLIIDGHQRVAVLLSMREEGYNIPLIPVDYIEADSEQDARNKLLHITSQYGEFNQDELAGWIKEAGEEISESIRIADSELKIRTPELTDFDIQEREDIDVQIETCPKCGFSWQK